MSAAATLPPAPRCCFTAAIRYFAALRAIVDAIIAVAVTNNNIRQYRDIPISHAVTPFSAPLAVMPPTPLYRRYATLTRLLRYC